MTVMFGIIIGLLLGAILATLIACQQLLERAVASLSQIERFTGRSVQELLVRDMYKPGEMYDPDEDDAP